MTTTDPAMNAFAAKVIGRLFGETLAHEIVHSLLGVLILPNLHNPASTPGHPVPPELMNNGFDRSFTHRTGLTDRAHSSPLVPTNFDDAGIAAINRLGAANQTLMNSVFPVAP
jgi:hypothetical protein